MGFVSWHGPTRSAVYSVVIRERRQMHIRWLRKTRLSERKVRRAAAADDASPHPRAAGEQEERGRPSRLESDGTFCSTAWGACYSARAGAVLRVVQTRSIAQSNRSSYDLNSAIAVIQDGGASLKVDTQHLRDINFRSNSTYQFIGELLIKPDNDAILQARIGRNVDGIDLNLYQQSLLIRRQYEAQLRSRRA
uniref:Uncharacterized protein n=1 Tax=Leersia perrieri TaxID=77586 RepID=A0A0D9WVP9_9ORYZ